MAFGSRLGIVGSCAAVFLLGACAGTTTQTSQGGYNAYVDEVTSSISSENGLTEWRGRQSAYLSNGQTQTVQVEFPGGKNYAVLGLCDGGCEDLDLKARAGGNLVAESDDSDGFPDLPDMMMSPASPTTFDIVVTMDKCSEPSCQYTLVFYSD